jgi:hypothetical protein
VREVSEDEDEAYIKHAAAIVRAWDEWLPYKDRDGSQHPINEKPGLDIRDAAEYLTGPEPPEKDMGAHGEWLTKVNELYAEMENSLRNPDHPIFGGFIHQYARPYFKKNARGMWVEDDVKIDRDDPLPEAALCTDDTDTMH